MNVTLVVPSWNDSKSFTAVTFALVPALVFDVSGRLCGRSPHLRVVGQVLGVLTSR